MFPFILEDVSLVSQIYTMIQQFHPNRWIIVSTREDGVSFIEFSADCLEETVKAVLSFPLNLPNLSGIKLDHFCLKEQNVAVMAS